MSLVIFKLGSVLHNIYYRTIFQIIVYILNKSNPSFNCLYIKGKQLAPSHVTLHFTLDLKPTNPRQKACYRLELNLKPIFGAQLIKALLFTKTLKLTSDKNLLFIICFIFVVNIYIGVCYEMQIKFSFSSEIFVFFLSNVFFSVTVARLLPTTTLSRVSSLSSEMTFSCSIRETTSGSGGLIFFSSALWTRLNSIVLLICE